MDDQATKCPSGEISGGEMSTRRNDKAAKFSSGEMSDGEMTDGEMSGRGQVGVEMQGTKHVTGWKISHFFLADHLLPIMRLSPSLPLIALVA